MVTNKFLDYASFLFYDNLFTFLPSLKSLCCNSQCHLYISVCFTKFYEFSNQIIFGIMYLWLLKLGFSRSFRTPYTRVSPKWQMENRIGSYLSQALKLSKKFYFSENLVISWYLAVLGDSIGCQWVSKERTSYRKDKTQMPESKKEKWVSKESTEE